MSTTLKVISRSVVRSFEFPRVQDRVFVIPKPLKNVTVVLPVTNMSVILSVLHVVRVVLDG